MMKFVARPVKGFARQIYMSEFELLMRLAAPVIFGLSETLWDRVLLGQSRLVLECREIKM